MLNGEKVFSEKQIELAVSYMEGYQDGIKDIAEQMLNMSDKEGDGEAYAQAIFEFAENLLKLYE